jgi:hypothetical protein
MFDVVVEETSDTTEVVGAIVVVIEQELAFQLPVQSVPIPTNVVSWKPAQAKCTRYNIM